MDNRKLGRVRRTHRVRKNIKKTDILSISEFVLTTEIFRRPGDRSENLCCNRAALHEKRPVGPDVTSGTCPLKLSSFSQSFLALQHVEEKQTRCHSVPVCETRWLCRLNVLPYIPSADTGSLWVCKPKNTRARQHTECTHNKHTHKEPITGPCSYLIPSMLCSLRIYCGEGHGTF